MGFPMVNNLVVGVFFRQRGRFENIKGKAAPLGCDIVSQWLCLWAGALVVSSEEKRGQENDI
jgi:hypothetical protein